MRSISSQNCRRDRGSTPVVGLVEDEKIRIVNEAAAKAELLPHAAGQLSRQAVGKRRKAGAVEKLGDSFVPLGWRLPEQAAKKLDVLADREIGVEVLAQSLRHEGNAGANREPMGSVSHVSPSARWRTRSATSRCSPFCSCSTSWPQSSCGLLWACEDPAPWRNSSSDAPVEPAGWHARVLIPAFAMLSNSWRRFASAPRAKEPAQGAAFFPTLFHLRRFRTDRGRQ